MDDAQWTIIGGLGNSEYRRVRYRYENDVFEGLTPIGAIAGAAGLAGRIERIVVVASPEAFAANAAAIRGDLGRLGVSADEPAFIRVEIDFHHSDAPDLVARVRDALGEPDAVLLDITGGPRQLPVLLRAALRMLATERDTVRVETWFAQVGGREGEDGRIFQLGSVDLIERLTSAHREFLRYGRADELATVFDDLHRERLRIAKSRGTVEQEKPGAISSVASAIRRTADAVVNALPLATAESDVVRRIDQHRERIDAVAPLARALLDRVRSEFARVARGTKRAKLDLDRAELDRQIGMTEAAIRRHDAGGASRLLSEALVNRVLLERGRIAPEEWLNHHRERGPASRAMQRLAPDHPVRALHDLVALGIRNGYAHGGYRPEKLAPERDLGRLREALDRFRTLLDDPVWGDCVVRAGDGVLGVTPLGLSPGVLWTFLEKSGVCFDTVLIATSQAARPDGEAMLARRKSPPRRVEWIVFDDPFEAPLRFEAAAAQLAAGGPLDDLLASIGEVVVNTAGGTTALQLAVDRVELRASRDFERPSRRCVVVDRRHAAGEPSDPLTGGELIWLDSEPRTS